MPFLSCQTIQTYKIKNIEGGNFYEKEIRQNMRKIGLYIT